MEKLPFYPIYRQATDELIRSGLTYGMVVTRDHIAKLCGLEKPITAAEQQKFNLDLMRYVSDIKNALLTDHRMLLHTTRNGAYVVIMPSNQVSVVVSSATKAIARELNKMELGVQYVRHDLLTLEERRKNADQKCKLAALASMQRANNSHIASVVKE